MPQPTNKITQIWQELKRRKVIHVIVVYATAAFVLIELVNNVYEPLRLPEWTPTMVIIPSHFSLGNLWDGMKVCQRNHQPKNNSKSSIR